ncbi:MAG TPA: ribbon-helix-helix domain-containing protein [Micavibrio sp.]|nr:ribbon-helix-helix domain-containing protein [Micavibrio sp.]
MAYHLQNALELDAEKENGSTLVSRNITVNGRRTSVRLEPEMWRALKEISVRENCSIHELCSLISFRKNKRTSLTAAIRVFLMLYFRAATTEEGHGRAGHGSFDSMKRRAGWHERANTTGPAQQPTVKPLPSFLTGTANVAA